MPIGAEGFPSKSPWHLAGNSILPPRETDYIIKSAMEEWANTVAVWPTRGICVAGGQAQSIQSNDRASHPPAGHQRRSGGGGIAALPEEMSIVGYDGIEITQELPVPTTPLRVAAMRWDVEPPVTWSRRSTVTPSTLRSNAKSRLSSAVATKQGRSRQAASNR